MFSIDLKITLDFNFLFQVIVKMRNICFGFKKSSVNQTKTFTAHILTCNQALPIVQREVCGLTTSSLPQQWGKTTGLKNMAKNGLNHHQQWVQEGHK